VSSDGPGWCFEADRRIDQNLREKIAGPRIYRFVFAPLDSGLKELYVGESERFEKRCASHIRALAKIRKAADAATDMNAQSLEVAWKEMARNPCVRIAAAIRNAEFDKNKVEVQLLTFEEFTLNGVEISTETLGNPYVRRLVENLAILSSDGPGVHIMNRGRDIAAKEFSRRLETDRKNYRDLHATQK
jgi:hypothetical protein